MVKEIKSAVGTDKLILGTDKIKKMLKQGKLKKIFLASNVSDEVRSDLERHGSISETEVELLDITNEDLGVLCKKPFPIAVIAKRK